MRSFLFIALLAAATPAASATTAPLNVAAWRADLDTLERELPIRHPAPFATGDTATAERALSAARAKTVNRYRSFERDVNALGYRLAAGGASAHAIQAFRLNTRAFPRSANAFDSLGEALLGAGYRDAAIAAYRHALEVEPGFPPSAQALQRLGVR